MSLFKKPWSLADGFIFGGGLILVGFLLQALSGPMDWSLVSSPVNIILLVALLALMAVARALKDKSGFFGWLSSSESAVTALGCTMFMTIVMGLTAQIPEKGWLGNMVSFWPFILCYIWLTVVAGLLAVGGLGRVSRSWKEIPYVLIHLGLFSTIVCATLGSADKKDLEMTLHEGETLTAALSEDGTSYETGLSVRLEDFTMEVYPSGMPKRFASDVLVRSKSGKEISAVIEVNKPLKVDGWKMYQYSYDEDAGTESKVSVLELVKDPWLPMVYAGIFMMLAGAFLMLVTGFKREEVK
ncbi:MAG: cytochrome c biogenesis protein ResB [Bacteroidales bacterium]|nr:cytochrome c biogenesis protein ResB [Bacteroidales bacterium]